jgi:hypothetical protein
LFYFCELKMKFLSRISLIHSCISCLSPSIDLPYMLSYVGVGVNEGIAYSVGANFTAYVLTVNSGEVICSFPFRFIS